MRLCGIDASTTQTGFAILDDGELTYQTTISLKSMKDTDERIKKMMIALGTLIKEYNPDCLFIENSWNANNIQTTMMLSNIIGAIMYICIATNTGFNKLLPSQWRKAIGIDMAKKKRPELKQEAIDYVKNKYGIEVNDDAAEAIGIANAAFVLTDNGKIFTEEE